MTKAIQPNPIGALIYDNRASVYRNLSQYANANADEAKACSLDCKYCQH